MASIDKKGIKDNLPAELERDETEHTEIEETKEEINSETHIRESVIKYCSSGLDQSDSDRSKIESVTESNSLEIHGSNKDEENLSKKDETWPKCKQEPLNTPVISPVKRKSPQIAKDETKRKRPTSKLLIEAKNDEILTEILNAQDPASYIVLSDKPDEHLTSTEVPVGSTAEGSIEEQGIAINRKDHALIKCKITETTDKTYLAGKSKSEVSNISKSSEHTQSAGALPQQQEEVKKSRRRCPRLIYLEDLENNPEFVESQKQILETIFHQRKQLTGIKPDSDHKEQSPKSFEKPKSKRE